MAECRWCAEGGTLVYTPYGLLFCTPYGLMPEANNLRVREVIYQGYRVIYRVQPDVIQIVTVIHGSRDASQLSSLDK